MDFAHYKVIEKGAMIVGIDVGGANTKVATSDGSFVRLIYAPLWRNKTIIYDVLADVKRGLEGEGIRGVGAVMTGELCGCFNTKIEGVLYIKNAVSGILRTQSFSILIALLKTVSVWIKTFFHSQLLTGSLLRSLYPRNTKT